jgi:hypothetical protein
MQRVTESGEGLLNIKDPIAMPEELPAPKPEEVKREPGQDDEPNQAELDAQAAKQS